MISNRVLGQQIRHYRTKRKMTQKDLALAVGVAPVHITKIETGRTGVSLVKLIMICNYLRISPSDVLTLDEQNDLELRKRWISEILEVFDELNTAQ